MALGGAAVLVVLVFLMAGGPWQSRGATAAQPAGIATRYQAVLLDNGQVYYGRLSGLGDPLPVLTDVYYVERRADPRTRQVKNVLVRLADQWHAPDRMVINAQHIVAVEPVAPESTVARLIGELRSGGP